MDLKILFFLDGIFSGTFFNMFRIFLVHRNNFCKPFPVYKGRKIRNVQFKMKQCRSCVNSYIKSFSGNTNTVVNAEKMLSISAFVTCESKSNLTIFPISLIKKLLLCVISCNFVIVVLIAVVSLSLISNKLDCDTNLLMLMSLFNFK